MSISSLQVLSKAPSTPWPPQPGPYGVGRALVNDEALFVADPKGQCLVRIDRRTGAQQPRFVCVDDGNDPVNVELRFSAVRGNTLWVIANTFGESKLVDATTGAVLATNHDIEVDAIAL